MTLAKLAAALCLAAGMFVAGFVTRRQLAPVAPPSSVRQVLYYTCPMHPQTRSDHPGDAPCCGMRLVPVFAGEAQPLASGRPGLFQIDAAERRLIGVRTAEVRRSSATYPLRVPGRIAPDDMRLYRLVAATDGWVRELGQNAAGTFIKQNQVLASYYVRDFQAAQQNYLYALQSSAQLQPTQGNIVPQRNTANINLRLALDALRSLGMSNQQIQELQQTREPLTEMRVYSPTTGFVLARNVSPALWFDKGTELYRIADISHVWVLTDIFEKDREFVRPGSTATVRYRGRELPARMSDVLPQFDPQSRTLKTRFELDNPGYILRPDMFVDVEVQVNMPAALTVPAEGVIDTGLRKTVYVDRGGGFLEAVEVKTGWRLGDRVQVTEGLVPGDQIVVAGNFLIDSESRMKAALVSAPGHAPRGGE